MNLFYIDSSAWVKKYFLEEGSEKVNQLFSESSHFACSTLGYIEILALLSRKKKASIISELQYEDITNRESFN